jgi:cytidine deaminase
LVDYSTSLDALTLDDISLLKAAQSVASRAFNPISKFHVGAAVRSSDGHTYRGTFFESSSLPLGVCAESAALAAAVTDGVSKFESIAIVGGDPHSTEFGQPITPCGGCRQRIFDVTDGRSGHVKILCANLALSKIYSLRIGHLLPLAFSIDNLPDGISGKKNR